MYKKRVATAETQGARQRGAQSGAPISGASFSMDAVRGLRVNLFCRWPMHHRGYGTQNLVASPFRPLMADPAVLRIRRWWGARSCRELCPCGRGYVRRVLYPLSQTVLRLHRLSTMPTSMGGQWRTAVRESPPGPGPPWRLRPTSDPRKGPAAGMSGPVKLTCESIPRQSNSSAYPL